VYELFDVFGLKGYEKSYPSKLSGGMIKKVALLRTYLFNDKIILFTHNIN
jgi:ABC-type nitrate/sulfonate/bicarbonate transport system ATPase subunit